MTSTVASSQGGAFGMMSFCPGINYPNYRDKYAGHSQWLDQSTEMDFFPACRLDGQNKFGNYAKQLGKKSKNQTLIMVIFHLRLSLADDFKKFSIRQIASVIYFRLASSMVSGTFIKNFENLILISFCFEFFNTF